jgi:hypothetical protein
MYLIFGFPFFLIFHSIFSSVFFLGFVSVASALSAELRCHPIPQTFLLYSLEAREWGPEYSFPALFPTSNSCKP